MVQFNIHTVINKTTECVIKNHKLRSGVYCPKSMN